MRDVGWEEISVPAGTTGSMAAVVLGGLFFGPFGALAGGTLFREPVYERRLRIHCACPVCGFRVTYIAK